ncbi:response regulator transcription factor [Actinoplanes oblitus]|uniref:Response regulator transcription factor n=1 Tax=Actinoplanes oblitus TaxID=3040509 RepID=A0ABY8WBM8_9ACTN|nr:response regulator transcription factor [Actinoplanes oblitus]WIM94531.1 response regulator transcription factor [Actinoplanes oblitus]
MTDLSAEQISVILVDDHALFREGLRQLITHQTEIAVLAEGASGSEAVALARRLNPDLVLLDVELPGQGAAKTVEQIREAVPSARIIILTMHDDPRLVQKLLSCGASAFLTKTIGRDQLLAAIRSVHRNADTVLVSVQRSPFAVPAPPPGTGVLSARELEVLRLLAQALSNAQIADRLFITEGTVKRHLTNVYAKLQAVSRVDAIRKATAAGLM